MNDGSTTSIVCCTACMTMEEDGKLPSVNNTSHSISNTDQSDTDEERHSYCHTVHENTEGRKGKWLLQTLASSAQATLVTKTNTHKLVQLVPSATFPRCCAHVPNCNFVEEKGGNYVSHTSSGFVLGAF